MKIPIHLFMYVSICLATLLLSGMDGCDTEEEAAPAVFIGATPPTGSAIQEDTRIVATFDAPPSGVDVNVPPGVTFSSSGTTVTITGQFPVGELNLVITWSGGTVALIYTVEPDIPLAPEGMVLIPAGEFEMGSEDADAEADEQPIHTVHVDAFYMDEHEVTNLEFKKFVLANPQWKKSRIPKHLHDGSYLKHWNGDDYPAGKTNHPVVYVNWYATMAYAEWAGKRLPTEAEWEKAARGGKSGSKYPWGNTISSGRANYGKNVGDTREVGSYSKNDYGLYDMSGNVYEWCLDAYDGNFYFSSPRRNPLSDVNTLSNANLIINDYANIKSTRVMRGGSWSANAKGARGADRNGRRPEEAYDFLGFRCAKSVSP